jgi:hypothetical protein
MYLKLRYYFLNNTISYHYKQTSQIQTDWKIILLTTVELY